jgi:hypothetical protein
MLCISDKVISAPRTQGTSSIRRELPTPLENLSHFLAQLTGPCSAVRRQLGESTRISESALDFKAKLRDAGFNRFTVALGCHTVQFSESSGPCLFKSGHRTGSRTNEAGFERRRLPTP